MWEDRRPLRLSDRTKSMVPEVPTSATAEGASHWVSSDLSAGKLTAVHQNPQYPSSIPSSLKHPRVFCPDSLTTQDSRSGNQITSALAKRLLGAPQLIT
ncbi:hypothetical protein BaRGS_00026761 [Batillaria attramentaria]|uniref:Uncharacterized protein n=1 Tax=Batillaria attramentaria TaxID=370345 RepID=A0ABD0K4R2_9CAEN